MGTSRTVFAHALFTPDEEQIDQRRVDVVNGRRAPSVASAPRPAQVRAATLPRRGGSLPLPPPPPPPPTLGQVSAALAVLAARIERLSGTRGAA